MSSKGSAGPLLAERIRVGPAQTSPPGQLGILAGLAKKSYRPPLQLSLGVEQVLKEAGVDYQSENDSDSSDQSESDLLDPARECPAGHPLSGFQTNSDGWSCDVCSAQFPAGTTLYGCAACNFDVCSSCKSSLKEYRRSVPVTPEALFKAIDEQQHQVVIDIMKQANSNGSRITCGTRVRQLLSATDDDGNTMLHRCVMSSLLNSLEPPDAGKSPKIAELLVSSKASVNSANMLGETPLLTAVRASAPQSLVQVLLEARADVGWADKLTGETALMEVSVAGDAELCCLLLEWEADPLQRSHAGLTAWDIAMSAGNEQIAALMPEAVVEPPPPPPAETVVEQLPRALRTVVKSGDHESVLATLKDLGANAAQALLETDGSGRTPLHACVELTPSSIAVDIARCLIEHSAPPDAKDGFGQSVLEIAVRKNCTEPSVQGLHMVRLLLESRADAAAVQAWREDNCALQRASSATVVGEHLCQLLLSSGAHLPWFQVKGTPADAKASPRAPAVCPKAVSGLDAALDSEVHPAEQGPAPESSQPDAEEAEAIQSKGSEEEVTQTSEEDVQTKAAAAETEFRPPTRALRGAAGLKSKCDENGIPFETLGMFGASDVLRELARLQALDLEALRNEAREGNLRAERCYDREELISRLKQARIWKVMSLPQLQAECRSKASKVVSEIQREEGVALTREALEEALAVAMWGGSTRTQVIHERCQAKQIPVDRLPDLDVAARLLEQIELLEEKSLEELLSEYKLRGFAPELAWHKADLLVHLQEVLTWEVLPLSELRLVCKRRSLPAKGEHRRADLLQLLASASWEARGVPMQRLRNLDVARSLLDRVESLEQQSLDELVEECREKLLPLESKPKQKDLVTRLRNFYVWSQLPIDEICRDLEARGVAFSPSETMAECWQMQLVVRLIRVDFLESKRIPVRRIGDLDDALELAGFLDELEKLPLTRLQQASEALDMPAESRLTKQQLLERILTVSSWDLFTTEELIKECEQHGIQTARSAERLKKDELRQELRKRLRRDLCMTSWKACGMPTDRLGSYENVAKVVQEFERLRTLDLDELGTEYAALGGNPKDLRREKLLERLRLGAVWKNLPMPELRKECRDHRIPVPMVMPGELLQRGLVEKLVRAVWESPTTSSQGQQSKTSKVPPPPSATGQQRPKLGVQPPPGKLKQFIPPKVIKAFEMMHLQPNSTVTANDVRKAFRQLALQYHPDKNPGALKEQADKKFRELHDAYKELCSYLQMT